MSKKKQSNYHQPKIVHHPSEQQLRTKENPGSTDYQTPAWQFHRCDEEHEFWGWNKLAAEDRLKVIKHLNSFETMTWSALKQQSGGKAEGRGTNHHPIPIANFTKSARNRLEVLKLDDVDELFSLRLTNTIRLYGIKDGRVLRLIWHDPHHGNNHGVCPTTKR